MNDDSGSTFQRNFERQVKIPSRPFSSFLNKVSLLLAWLSLLVLNKNQAKTKTKKREGCFVTICSGFREISINYYHFKGKGRVFVLLFVSLFENFCRIKKKGEERVRMCESAINLL